MQVFPYTHEDARSAQIGLIALQTDETIERDFRRLIPEDVDLMVSRVPFAEEVSPETLRDMEDHLRTAAALFPRAADFASVGYGCTSGTSQIGASQVARQVRLGTLARSVTDPVTALLAACAALGVRRLALLSPYVEDVSNKLREVLEQNGVAVTRFGSFAEAEDAKVVSIDRSSIVSGAQELMRGADEDALFLSCTNLRTLDVIEPLEDMLGVPVLSSNQVLAWHMLKAADCGVQAVGPGKLLRQ